MSRKKKIKLVEPPAPVSGDVSKLKPRNFWNTCPRKLEYLPDSPCNMGCRSVKANSEETEECPWSINSKEANYCFWKWLAMQSAPDGSMEAKKQDEVAELLNWSSTKVHFTCKNAIQAIKKGPYAKVLAELNPGTNSDPESDSEFQSLASSIPSGEDEH